MTSQPFNEADHPRSSDGSGQFTERPQQDPGNGVLNDASPASVDLRLGIACNEAGFPMMNEIFTIVRDREQVEDGRLMRVDAREVDTLYYAHVGPAVDHVEDDLIAGQDAPNRKRYTDDQVAAHLAEVCKQAGLGSMTDIFQVIRDREVVRPQALMQLDADDVTYLYEEYVEPAVDSVEDDLLGVS